MKIPKAIAELVSEFSGLNRTPDFKPVTSAPPCPQQTQSGRTTPTYGRDRRHSVVITVGAEHLPKVPSDLPARKKSTTSEVKFRKNRRQSAPCIGISSVASSTSLKEKLSKLRSANSSGDEDDHIHEEEDQEENEDFHVNNKSRKKSALSYRVA